MARPPRKPTERVVDGAMWSGVLLIGLPKVSREEVRRFGRNIEIG